MFFRESSKVDFDVNLSSNILANSNHLKIPFNLDLLVQPSKLNTYTIGLIIDHFFAISLFSKLHMPYND